MLAQQGGAALLRGVPQGGVGAQGQAQGQKVGAQGHVLLAIAFDLGISPF